MRNALPAVLLAVFISAAVAQEKERFENLGVQVQSLMIQGTTFAKDVDGRDVACTVIRGQPAKLLVFNLRDGALLHRMPLAAPQGAWNATTTSDGSVYIGTDDNGHLYRWIPGETEVRDLGQVLKDQTFAWDVAAGNDGEVFVATYGGCNIVRYHPNDGFSDVGRGAMAAGENYARAVAFDPAGERIFAGVGAHAHLVELNLKSGEKKDLFREQLGEKKFVYGLDVVGGKLFAQVTEPSEGLVIDLKTMQIETKIPDVGGQLVVAPKSPYDDTIYFCGQKTICAYDPGTLIPRLVPGVGPQVIIGMGWVKYEEPDFPGATLVTIARPARMIRYHPKTGKLDARRLAVPPEPVPIQSLCRGANGNIYVGGYLSGGLTEFDPKTGKGTQHGIGQPEGMATLGSKMYVGVYPNGKLYEFDTKGPWQARQIDALDRFDQDRPMTVLGVEPLKKVFFGTIPDYGLLGGALVVYDPATTKLDVHRNVVKDQSVVSLAYAKDLIVAGTSIAGGLGVEPTTKDAQLFLWDPAKNEKVFETVVTPGAAMITGLVTAPDGMVWGVADGDLFVFDPTKREVVYKNTEFAVNPAARHSKWRDAFLAFHPSGAIYGTATGKFFSIDPVTKKVTFLRDNAQLLALDNDGRVYFKDGTNLIRYAP